MGQASPQPMVMMTSDSWAASQVSLIGVWSVMSIPTSRMASTTAGLMWWAGSEPADRTSTASPARWRSQPAAIWERPAVCTQTNRTLGLSLTAAPFGSGDGGAAAFEEDHVAPDAVVPAEALPGADRTEAAGGVQGEAGGVLREHSGLDGPDPGPLGRRDQGVEQGPADAPTTGV